MFEVNWENTQVQALSTRVNVPSIITVQGQQVAAVDQFVFVSDIAIFVLKRDVKL